MLIIIAGRHANKIFSSMLLSQKEHCQLQCLFY